MIEAVWGGLRDWGSVGRVKRLRQFVGRVKRI